MITHELKTQTEKIKVSHDGNTVILYLENEVSRKGVELLKNELHDLIGILLHVQAKLKK